MVVARIRSDLSGRLDTSLTPDCIAFASSPVVNTLMEVIKQSFDSKKGLKHRPIAHYIFSILRPLYFLIIFLALSVSTPPRLDTRFS